VLGEQVLGQHPGILHVVLEVVGLLEDLDACGLGVVDESADALEDGGDGRPTDNQGLGAGKASATSWTASSPALRLSS
jgi:hypothetical protein